MFRFSISCIVFITLISCNSTVVFDNYTSIPEAKWHKDSILKFEFNPIDTVSRNNIYVNLRNTKNFAYNNLFLIVDINFPNQTKVTDTLEYEMADAEGKFLGSGLTDLKENKLEYKTNVIFPNTGTYTISVQHAMRKSGDVGGLVLLEGITDVGLQIEKITTND